MAVVRCPLITMMGWRKGSWSYIYYECTSPGCNCWFDSDGKHYYKEGDKKFKPAIMPQTKEAIDVN